jgi:hypothetical protein
MVDATLGTNLQTEGQRRQWQIAPEVGPTPRNPDTEYPKFSSLRKLLSGSKRDGCVVRNFADVFGVAHEAIQHSHALCRTICLRHRGKPPAVDESLHAFCLAPSTRHDPHSCAHAQLNGDSPRQFPSFQASAPATWALRFTGIQSRLCKQAFRAQAFSAPKPR